MKRNYLIMASVLLCSLSVGFVSYAAESETEADNLISFRGFDWYSPSSSIKADLEAIGIEDNVTFIGAKTIERHAGSSLWTENHSGASSLSDSGYETGYTINSGMTVAGTTPSRTYMYYMYPISEAGEVIASNDDAEFYLGIYEYSQSDYQELDALFEDFTNKLTSLYGECYKYVGDDVDYYRNEWIDSKGNTVKMLLFPSSSLRIAYEAGDATERLDQLKATIDEKTRLDQAEARKGNEDNTDGL